VVVQGSKQLCHSLDLVLHVHAPSPDWHPRLGSAASFPACSRIRADPLESSSASACSFFQFFAVIVDVASSIHSSLGFNNCVSCGTACARLSTESHGEK
jgi:hypothetical protein